MKDKIDEAYARLKLLIEGSEYLNKYHQSDLRDAKEPRRDEKEVFRVFHWARWGNYKISDLLEAIEEAKRQTAGLNRAELVIDNHREFIKVVYYETEQEIYDRLCAIYNYLFDDLKRHNEYELEEYKKLKAKYE